MIDGDDGDDGDDDGDDHYYQHMIIIFKSEPTSSSILPFSPSKPWFL